MKLLLIFYLPQAHINKKFVPTPANPAAKWLLFDKANTKP